MCFFYVRKNRSESLHEFLPLVNLCLSVVIHHYSPHSKISKFYNFFSNWSKILIQLNLLKKVTTSLDKFHHLM